MKRSALARLFNPLPQDQQAQGFRPNGYIRALKAMSRLIIVLLRLTGASRWSNEFIQALDPRVSRTVRGMSLVFRTGHGRLLWRAHAFDVEEPEMIDWICAMPDSAVFCDIGANVGCYSVFAAKRGIQTLAIEAEAWNYSLLMQNVFLNDVQRKVVGLQLPLGETSGLETLYMKQMSPGDALHSVGRPSGILDANRFVPLEIRTPVVSLDDAIRLFQLPVPTHIKIDVDGNEWAILKGLAKTLPQVSEVMVEIDDANPTHRDIASWICARGFVQSEKHIHATGYSEAIGNVLFKRKIAS